MRVFTCTPVAFGGGPDFFARDSGLLCKGFQALGHSCKAVMPLPSHDADQLEDLIRTEPSNLQNDAWWRELNADLVILYAWGSPRYAPIARAIRRSGTFLVLNQDNGGLVSPLTGFGPWLSEQQILGGWHHTTGSRLRTWKLAIRGLTAGLAYTDPMRAEHLSHGHIIACVSPKAARSYRKLCRIYRGKELARKVALLPHAVEPRFRPGQDAPRRRIVCIGRWQDSLQKRPRLMCEALGYLLEVDPQVTVAIAGHLTDEMEAWRRSLPSSSRERVCLHGRMEREALATLLGQSQILYSSSAFESFGIAAAEALCCGCSVVAQRSVSMASFEWFVSETSGQLAESGDAHAHMAALRAELAAWDSGLRDAARISSVWSKRLHADQVAGRILELMSEARSGKPTNKLGLPG